MYGPQKVWISAGLVRKCLQLLNIKVSYVGKYRRRHKTDPLEGASLEPVLHNELGGRIMTGYVLPSSLRVSKHEPDKNVREEIDEGIR